MTKTVLITGSTRGIGLAFVRYYQSKGWKVIGCARNLQNADKLQALSPYRIVQLDATDDASIRRAAEDLKGEAIDLLINNAGIGEADSLDEATKEGMIRQFEVNAIGPLFVTRAFLPHLREAATHHGHATVCQLSSILGSIEEQASFGVTGYYGYKISKAALNMFNSCFASEYEKDRIVSVCLHPGYVNTDMTSGQGPLPADESVAGMTKILDRLTPEDTGKFFDYQGRAMAW